MECNILKYEKLAYKRWCLDQDVNDGLYDLREDTREECPICMIGIPEPTNEMGVGLEITHCCFQTICASCKYAHAQTMKKDNIQSLVKSKYYADKNKLYIDVGTDDPKTWKHPSFTCPFCRVPIATSEEEFKARRAAKVKGKTDAQVCEQTLFNIAIEYILAIQRDVENNTKPSINNQKKYMENVCRSAYLGHPYALKLLAMIYMGANRLFDFNELGIPVDLKKGSLMLKASAKFGKLGCASAHRWLVFECGKLKEVDDTDEPSWIAEKNNLLHLKAAVFYGDETALNRVKTINSLEKGSDVYNAVYDDDLLKSLEVLEYDSFADFTVELEKLYNDYCERVHSDEREHYNKLTKPNLAVAPSYEEIMEHVKKIGTEAQEKLGCNKPEVRFNIQAILRLSCGRDLTEVEKLVIQRDLNKQGFNIHERTF